MKKKAATVGGGKQAIGKSSKPKKGGDLDGMLDAALNEFEEMEMTRKVQEEQAASQHKKDQKEKSAAKAREDDRRARADELQRLLNGVEDPSFGPTVQSTLKALSTTQEGNATVDDLFASIAAVASVSQRSTSTFLPRGPDDAEGIAGADAEVSITPTLTPKLTLTLKQPQPLTPPLPRSLPPPLPRSLPPPQSLTLPNPQVTRTLKMLADAQKGMQGFEAGRLEEAGESMMEDMMSQVRVRVRTGEGMMEGMMSQVRGTVLGWDWC